MCSVPNTLEVLQSKKVSLDLKFFFFEKKKCVKCHKKCAVKKFESYNEKDAFLPVHNEDFCRYLRDIHFHHFSSVISFISSLIFTFSISPSLSFLSLSHLFFSLSPFCCVRFFLCFVLSLLLILRLLLRYCVAVAGHCCCCCWLLISY